MKSGAVELVELPLVGIGRGRLSLADAAEPGASVEDASAAQAAEGYQGEDEFPEHGGDILS